MVFKRNVMAKRRNEAMIHIIMHFGSSSQVSTELLIVCLGTQPSMLKLLDVETNQSARGYVPLIRYRTIKTTSE